jgi:hypothetical protein
MTNDRDNSRLEAFHTVRSALANLSDAELCQKLRVIRTSTTTGAQTSLITIADKPVFVKRIALSKSEAERPMSTANIFQLPLFFQYGVDSRGFGAWRELSASIMTTEWVLKGETKNFRLLYHHRILPTENPAALIDKNDLDSYTAYWDGNENIRARILATETSTTELVMFFEFIPHVLWQWVTAGIDDRAAATMLFRDALPTFDLMRQRGLTHFDAHWENVLTDGERLYFSDMGLASSQDFDLTSEEREFLREHESTYDYALFARGLFRVILRMPNGGVEMAKAILKAPDVAAQAVRLGIPPVFACLLEQFGELAWQMMEFINAVTLDKHTPYPRKILEEALERARRMVHMNSKQAIEK